jgi:hypothetical protein
VCFVQTLRSVCQIGHIFFHIFDRSHNVGQKLSWSRVKLEIL